MYIYILLKELHIYTLISTLITTTKESRGNSGDGGDVPSLYAQVNKENREPITCTSKHVQYWSIHLLAPI